jgi:Domain of unknown function (DUF4157)
MIAGQLALLSIIRGFRNGSFIPVTRGKRRVDMRRAIPKESVSKESRSKAAGSTAGAQSLKSMPRHLAGPGGSTLPARLGLIPVNHAFEGRGAPVDAASRQFAEPALGVDFSGVRVHTDDAAARFAQKMRARALTVGEHIVFGQNQHRPNSEEGRRLIVHELTHVAQQRSARAGGEPEVAAPNHPLEQNARAVLAEGAPLAAASQIMIQRQSVDQPLPPVSLTRPPKERPSVMSQKLGFHLLADDQQRIRDFLAVGHLSVGAALNPVFEGAATTLDDITDRARSLVLPIIPRSEVMNFVTGAWLRVLVTTTELPPLPSMTFQVPPESAISSPTTPPGGQQSTPDVLSDWQVMAGGQWTYHLNSRDPASTTVQVQFTKGSGAAQAVLQYQVDTKTGAAQYMGGVQLQASAQTDKLKRFIGAAVQAQIFLQLLYGLTQARGEAWGAVTFQIQAGAQVTATWEKSKISLSLQIGPSLTLQDTQRPAWDFNVAPAGGGTGALQGGTPQPGFAGITLRF